MRTARFTMIAVVFLAMTGSVGGHCGADANPGPGVKRLSTREARMVAEWNRAPGKAWQDFNQLVEDQQFEKASGKAAAILDKARKDRDTVEETRALVNMTRVRIGLHGYETAVRFLADQPRPDDDVARLILDLQYAQALRTYGNVYSWEIRQRERVAGDSPDLKTWTMDRIGAAMLESLDSIWKRRAALGRVPATALPEYVTEPDHPDGIRDTMRDTATYLIADFLADSGFWTPAHSAETWRLALPDLLAGAPGASEGFLTDASLHPLAKLSAVLGDLEKWHRADGRAEAALEAFLERARHLYDNMTEVHDRADIRTALAGRLERLGSLPWWSKGMALLAEWTRNEDAWDALIRARNLARAGREAHPETPGGLHCTHVEKALEAPSFNLEGMATDAPDRKSLGVNARNLDRLHFRAWRFDLKGFLEKSDEYRVSPDRKVLDALMVRPPAKTWSVELPPMTDLRDHRTFVTPPIAEPGYYVVMASAREDFAADDNVVAGLLTGFGNLVFTTTQQGGEVEVRVLSGDKGRPLKDAVVRLHRYDWRQRHRVEERQQTGSDGIAVFKASAEGGHFFLTVEHGSDVVVTPNPISLYREGRSHRQDSALIYTDRSIYRPGQDILFKTVVYQGDAAEGRFVTRPETPVVVTLHDGNGQAVESLNLATNRHGTTSGSFTIPAGRILGRWRLSTDRGGSASVSVEEYKRPTFEARILPQETPMRLNRPAVMKGEARYHFGLPVTEGRVAWKVTRVPVFPWWFWGRSPDPDGGRIVASGTATLAGDGTFQVAFTPEADERSALAGSDMSWRYELGADITDEGGETRSARRVFRVGFSAVEAVIRSDTGFLDPGRSSVVTVIRSDLDGTPLAGEGEWRLVALEGPATALLPADQPMADAPDLDPDAPRTEGDRMRSRWNPGYTPIEILRLWKDGPGKAAGTVTHGPNGEGRIALPALAPGAWRLVYETVDAFGAPFRTRHEFVVGGPDPDLPLPLVLTADKTSVRAGQTARLLAHSGLPDQQMTLDLFRDGRRFRQMELVSGRDPSIINLPVTPADRGGFVAILTAVRDHQVLRQEVSILVPWDDRTLGVEFETFREMMRPGAREKWTVKVTAPGGRDAAMAGAEVLAYMFDRSLDAFVPHSPPRMLSLYPHRAQGPQFRTSLHIAPWLQGESNGFRDLPGYPVFSPAAMIELDSYGIGGPGRRGMMFREGGGRGMMQKSMPMAMAPASASVMTAEMAEDKADAFQTPDASAPPRDEAVDAGVAAQAPAIELRSNFSETAFWEPHLVTGSQGTVSFEFQVPDSVTSWNVWVHALTRDMKSGTATREARSVKDLMVRPYLPRFLREGDRAVLKVVVNNASDRPLSGTVDFEIEDPATGASLASEFGISRNDAVGLPFKAPAGGGTTLSFPVTVPARVGTVAFRVTARSGDFSDGELRPIPVLPGRFHLAQSRFATLRGSGKRVLVFDDLARNDDSTRIDGEMVVTVDAQLFQSVLSALPYLIDYPYECVEQTLNRFLSTGILGSLYDRFPAVARMAREMSGRETRLETWDDADPNRKMALEETPWVRQAKGGSEPDADLVRVLDPRVARAQRDASLAKLAKTQTSSGGFPWFPGGPPSPTMSLYLAYGFSKALEFGVEVPLDMVSRTWAYLHRHYLAEAVQQMQRDEIGWEFVTFLNFALSNLPDATWTGGVFSDADRKTMLEFSFKHWRSHSPYLKGFLALTLHRAGRTADARKVWASVMDSAKTGQDQGTFWTPEDRSWLWYNDTIETHAFALRTVLDLEPDSEHLDGLVLWLFLNKKLNHWKSTRATAEVLYALASYFRVMGGLDAREAVEVSVGDRRNEFVFEPDRYTGRKNQLVVPGPEIRPEADATITVTKDTPGFVLASATWHYSTETLPTEARGDFLSVERTFYKRTRKGTETVMEPLAQGASIAIGDEVEIHLSISSKHQMEYVHLRDPRAAGFEPGSSTSRYRWDLGLARYEEVRDSGMNFFFEYLPHGEYTLKHRVRATTSGTFKVAPATLQPMYAPEFAAFSAGAILSILPE